VPLKVTRLEEDRWQDIFSQNLKYRDGQQGLKINWLYEVSVHFMMRWWLDSRLKCSQKLGFDRQQTQG
jgi:hypothetical protein